MTALENLVGTVWNRLGETIDIRYLPLAPALAYVGLLLVVPLAYLAVISVHAFDPIEIVGSDLTLDNYVRFLSDPFYRGFIYYTLRIAIAVTAICVLFGYPLGYFLARTTPRKRSAMLFLIVLPLMAGLVVRIYGWLRIFGQDGVLNQVWLALFDGRLQVLNTTTAVVVGLVGVLLPFVVLPVYSSVQGIDPSLERAARNLGANEFQVLRKVIVPLSLPGVVLGSVFCFTLTMSSVVTPLLLGGRQDVTIGALMYDVAVADSNWPFSGSMAVSIAIINVVLVFAYFRLSRRHLGVDQ